MTARALNLVPTPHFIALTRNPALSLARPRETAREIAFRLRNGIAPEPIVMRLKDRPNATS